MDLKKTIREEIRLMHESSLSRIQQHSTEHECAIISASRTDPKDLTKCVDPKKVEKEPSNLERGRKLKAALLASGYGVTAIKGSYIENFETPQAVEVSEDSLFVVNLKDNEQFFDEIRKLGYFFCQDSVLLMPLGGKDCFLLGTNKSEFPGLNNKAELGSLRMGKSAEFMSKIRNRPFIVGESLETYQELTRLERMAVKAISKKVFSS